jgi:YVTN family beta-propeller protein
MFPRSRSLLRQLSRAGAILVTLVATAAFAGGPKAYVGNFKDNTVSVIDTDAGAVVATMPVGAGPHGMVVSPDGRAVYISGDLASTVSVIDTASDRVAQTIEVGKAPHGLAMMSDGKLLLVAVYGEDRIAFVDTSTRAVMGTVPVPKPHTIAIRPDDKVAYVTSQEPGHFALAVVDLATRSVVRNLPLDKTPRDLEFSYDAKALYYTLAGVNAIQVLDPVSDKVVAEIPTGASPHIAGYYRGTTVGVGVIQGPGELLLFNPVTNAAVRSVVVGKQPHWVATTGDGKRAYVTNEGSNDLTVVDLATGQTTTIAVGNAPRKVVVQRTATTSAKAGAKVSIANFAFTPTPITIAPGESVVWTNDDGAPHGLAYHDGAKGVDPLLPGASFSRRFDQPGAHEYNCSVHPYMIGRVVVRAE